MSETQAAARPSVSRRSAVSELAADAALLAEGGASGVASVRWYLPSKPALVLGFAQRLRASELVDTGRCEAAGVEVVARTAGGGLVLLDDGLLCLTVALPLPHPLAGDDLTRSYAWLGSAISDGLHDLGVESRVVSIAEARQVSAELRDPLLRATCYAGVSPFEVLVGSAKLAGLAQVRRRDVALYQAGIQLRDQSALADLVRCVDDSERSQYRSALRTRTVGLRGLLARPMPLEEIASAVGSYVKSAIGSPN